MRRLPPVLAPVLAAAALLAAAVPAVATPPVGADVSAPQAGAPLPADAAFGIVGVNGGTFADLNPDFARQWQQWAVARPGGPPQVYVLSANPGSAGASWGQPGPSNACDGSSGDPDCASDYGFNGAQRALAAATGVVTRPVTWWVDIEGARTARPGTRLAWTSTPTCSAASWPACCPAPTSWPGSACTPGWVRRAR